MARLGAAIDSDPFTTSPAADRDAKIPTVTVTASRLDRGELVDKWVERGYPKPAAEGIVDNMIRESGGASSVIGDGGTSGGLFQHHATRLSELKDYAAKAGKPWTDPDIQIDFADQEMKTKFPKLRESMLAATDRGAAEDQFKRVFERPASVLWANRADGQPVLGNDKYGFSDYALAETQGKRNRSLLMMSPADYLDLSPPFESDPASSRSGRALRASLDRGDKVEQVPSLAIKVGRDGSAEMTDQDGRHRALLAQEAGLDAIPVAVQQTGRGQPTEIKGMSGTILPFDFAPHPAAGKPPPSRGGGVLDWLMPSAEAAELAPAGAGNPFANAKLGPATTADPFSAEPAAAGDKRGIMERVGTGMLDAFVGIGQGIANIPDPMGFIPGPQRALSAAGTDKANALVADRERAIQGDRGGADGVDWWRLAGNVASPANLLPMAALGRPASLAGMLGRSAAAGAMGGATQPVTEGNFATGKAEQVALGAVAGAAVGAAGEAIGRGVGFLNPLLRYVKGIGGPRAAEKAAVKEVVRRIEKDAAAGGPTAQDMIDLADAVPHKPLTLADVGGQGVLATAGRVARAPGESAQIMAKAMNERDAAAGTRLVADVDSGISGGSAYDAATALSQARAAAAQPKYQAAFAQPITMAQVRPVQRYIQDKIGQEALQAGMRVMEIESLGVGSAKHFDPTKFGVVRGQSGAWIIDPDVLTGKTTPSMRMMDAVKRGYDEIVEGFRDPVSGRLNLNQYGRAVNDARADYVGYLRKTFDKYGEALDSWSGPSRSLDAVRAGQRFLTQRPEEIARRMADLSPSDREFYKLGAADKLRQAIATKGPQADEAKAILRSDYMRQQLRPLFDNEDGYNRFVASVDAEGRMFGTRFETLRGSQTAARQAEDRGPEAEAFAHAARGAVHAAHGNVLGMVGNALRAITAMAKAPDPEHAAAVAKLLTEPLGQNGAAMSLLRNFSSILPTTRNYMLEGMRRAAPAAAPGAGIMGAGAIPTVDVYPQQPGAR